MSARKKPESIGNFPSEIHRKNFRIYIEERMYLFLSQLSYTNNYVNRFQHEIFFFEEMKNEEYPLLKSVGALPQGNSTGFSFRILR